MNHEKLASTQMYGLPININMQNYFLNEIQMQRLFQKKMNVLTNNLGVIKDDALTI